MSHNFFELMGVPCMDTCKQCFPDVMPSASTKEEGEKSESMIDLDLHLKSYSQSVHQSSMEPELQKEYISYLKRAYGPERPHAYTSEEHRKRLLAKLKALSKTFHSNVPVLLDRVQLVERRFKLLPYKVKLRTYKDRETFSIFVYLPFQNILKEYTCGLDSTLLSSGTVPIGFLSEGVKPYEVVKLHRPTKTYSSKVLFSRRKYMMKTLRELVGIRVGLFAYAHKLEDLIGNAKLRYPYPGSVEAGWIVLESDIRRDILHSNPPLRKKYRHAVEEVPSRKGAPMEFLSSNVASEFPEEFPQWF